MCLCSGIKTIDDLEIINKIGEKKIDVTIGSALDIYGGSLEFKKLFTLIRNRKQIPL